jgi:hypothetical protein
VENHDGHKLIVCSCGRIIFYCACIKWGTPAEVRQHPACEQQDAA